MKSSQQVFSLLLSLLYVLFGFLSLHTINSVYFYLLCAFFVLYFLQQQYLKLSFSLFVTAILLMPIWLFFNNLLYEYLLHYTLISDVLTTFVISFVFSLINSTTKLKMDFIYVFLPIVTLTFYNYYAYDSLIYWSSIVVMIVSGLNIFRIEYVKTQNRKIQLMFLLAYLVVVFFFLFDMFKEQNTEKIAVLKSDWCDVSVIPNKMSHKINYYYAYSDFLNILKGYGDVDIISHQDINDSLVKYNVVVLITPTIPIDNIHVQKLMHFVDKGGRLVLITDHTNLYGHIDCVNGLLYSFGIRINDDAVFDSQNYYEKAILNTNSLELDKIIMKTGNSIIPPPISRVWGITPKIISEKADYTKENFFGDLSFTPDDCVGNFVVGVTIQKGLGSFVIWNDSTLFSNFALTQKDNIKLLDYIMKNKIYNNNDREVVYKFINIDAENNDIFLEAPPNHMPNAEHFSTLIANFSRNNLFPTYHNNQSKETVFFTSYNYLKENISQIKSSKIVLIDSVPDDNFLQVKKYSFDDYMVTDAKDNFYYSTNGRCINVKYNDKDIVLAKNVLSDNELGTWWNLTSISPYKKEMIDRFFVWIQSDRNIEIYRYPDLCCRKGNYVVEADNNTKEYWDNVWTSHNMMLDDNQIVYLGNRKWAFVVNSTTYFGNPELSDNYLNTLNVRWTAKRVSKK